MRRKATSHLPITSLTKLQLEDRPCLTFHFARLPGAERLGMFNNRHYRYGNNRKSDSRRPVFFPDLSFCLSPEVDLSEVGVPRENNVMDGCLQFLTNCNLRTRRALARQNRTESSNLSSSAIQSELHRICARSAPKYANNARISRLFTSKPDFRERTARRRRGHRPAFSPEGTYAVRFQQGASGECNAIRNR